MKVNEELQEEESNNTEVLSDLSVTDEQASKTSGGDTFSVNYAKIEYSYKPQKPDGSLD